MDQREIDEYVHRCQQLIESSPQMDEENTKVKLVQPFLELLGWDLYSTEVSLEYRIPMASGNTHGKQTRIRDLAKQVGISVEFLGEWQADGISK